MNSAKIINISSRETMVPVEVNHPSQKLYREQSPLSKFLTQPSIEYVMVYNSGDYRRVSVFEIIVIKSNGNYSTFYLDDGSKILTSKTLKYWEVTLNHPDLVRVHYSNLINRSKIKSVNVGNSEIALTANLTSKYSRMPKSELLSKLKLQF